MKERVQAFYDPPSQLPREIIAVLKQFEVTPVEMLWYEASHILPIDQINLWWTTATDPGGINEIRENAQLITIRKTILSQKTSEMGQAIAPWFGVSQEYFQMSKWQDEVYTSIWDTCMEDDGDDWYATSLLAGIPALFPDDPLAWEKFDAVYWTRMYQDTMDELKDCEDSFENIWQRYQEDNQSAFDFFHPKSSNDPEENERYKLIKQLQVGSLSPAEFAKICLTKSFERIQDEKPYFELPAPLPAEVSKVLRKYHVTPADILWDEASEHIIPTDSQDLPWFTETGGDDIQALEEKAREIQTMKGTWAEEALALGKKLTDIPLQHFEMSQWQYAADADVWDRAIGADEDEIWYTTSLLAIVPGLYPAIVDPLTWEKFEAVYWLLIYKKALDDERRNIQSFDDAWKEYSREYQHAYALFHPQPSDDPEENMRYELVMQLKQGVISPVDFAKNCLEKSSA